jgi:hypothetical protein
MGVILLVLLLALILGGLGFAAHVLWWIALVVFVAWLVGFGFVAGVFGPPRPRASGQGSARALRSLRRSTVPEGSR